jgi:hypothetical protein
MFVALARAHIKGRILSSSSSLENIRVESSSPPPTCDSSNNIVCFGSLEMGWISSHAPASSHHYVILPGGLRDKVRSPQDLANAVCLDIPHALDPWQLGIWLREACAASWEIKGMWNLSEQNVFLDALVNAVHSVLYSEEQDPCRRAIYLSALMQDRRTAHALFVVAVQKIQDLCQRIRDKDTVKIDPLRVDKDVLRGCRNAYWICSLILEQQHVEYGIEHEFSNIKHWKLAWTDLVEVVLMLPEFSFCAPLVASIRRIHQEKFMFPLSQ